MRPSNLLNLSSNGLRLAAAIVVLAAGIAIAWVDSRPRWDDAGITAGAIILAAFLATVARVTPALAVALTAGPVVVVEIDRGWGVLLAILVAAVGAICGACIRRVAARQA